MIEIWLPVSSFEGLYDVSDRGRMFNLRRNRVMKTPVDGAGYPQVNIGTKDHHVHSTIHVLVLTAFAGPRPRGTEARHLNGDKTDNRWPENLAWGTRSVNQMDRVTHGNSNRGERHGLHKFTEDEVLEIRSRAALGETASELALVYSRSRQGISHIINGTRWGWLDDLRHIAHPARGERAGGQVNPSQVPGGYSRAGQLAKPGALPDVFEWVLSCHECAALVEFQQNAVRTHDQFHITINSTVNDMRSRVNLLVS